MSVKESIGCKGRTQYLFSLYFGDTFPVAVPLQSYCCLSATSVDVAFHGLPDNVSMASCWEINGERTS